MGLDLDFRSGDSKPHKSFQGDDTIVTVRSVEKRPAAECFVIEPVGPDGKIEVAKTRPNERMAVLLTIRPTDRTAQHPT